MKPPKLKGEHSLFLYQNEPYCINTIGKIEKYNRIEDEWQETIIDLKSKLVDPLIFNFGDDTFRISGFDYKEFDNKTLKWRIKEMSLKNGLDNFLIKDLHPKDSDISKIQNLESFKTSYFDLRNEDTNVLKLGKTLLTFNHSKKILSSQLETDGEKEISVFDNNSGNNKEKNILKKVLESYLNKGTKDFKIFGRHI